MVAHETAHQWFGDAVTQADWHHLWLSEGFATYLAALWRRHADGDSAFRAGMQSRRRRDLRLRRTTERPIIDTAQSDLLDLLNSNNYQKGAWVLHQLRGPHRRFRVLRGLCRYYSDYRDSTALSADFAGIMSQAAGEGSRLVLPSGAHAAGYPMLEVRWKHKGKKLTLDIAQTQKAEWGTYRIPGLEILWMETVPDRRGWQADPAGGRGRAAKPKKVEWIRTDGGFSSKKRHGEK